MRNPLRAIEFVLRKGELINQVSQPTENTHPQAVVHFPKPPPTPPTPPTIPRVVKAKPIAQTIARRPPVTINQTRAAPSSVGGAGICPAVMPQPFPPAPLDLQKLLVSPQRPPNPKAPLLGPITPKTSLIKTGKAKYTLSTAPPKVIDSEFVKQAMDPALNDQVSPVLRKHQDCNEDLLLGSFTKSKLIWDGSQKKGATPAFTAESYLDHIAQAVKQDPP